MTTNAARIAARIREMLAAIEARQPVHPEGPTFPGPEVEGAERARALGRYDAYAMGALSSLASFAAAELERRA